MRYISTICCTVIFLLAASVATAQFGGSFGNWAAERALSNPPGLAVASETSLLVLESLDQYVEFLVCRGAVSMLDRVDIVSVGWYCVRVVV